VTKFFSVVSYLGHKNLPLIHSYDVIQALSKSIRRSDIWMTL